MGTNSNFGNVFSMAAASVFLPFLPMLPTQILLNNFLYDVAQLAIPTDNVDDSYLRRPQRWNMRVIRDFMLFIGPISSAFDFLTFYVLLRVVHASEATFHTGWFVESLATQTLVLFVIRTAGNPFRSTPSPGLILTALATLGIGVALPWTPLAGALGFTPLPWTFLLFLMTACACISRSSRSPSEHSSQKRQRWVCKRLRQRGVRAPSFTARTMTVRSSVQSSTPSGPRPSRERAMIVLQIVSADRGPRTASCANVLQGRTLSSKASVIPSVTKVQTSRVFKRTHSSVYCAFFKSPSGGPPSLRARSTPSRITRPGGWPALA